VSPGLALAERQRRQSDPGRLATSLANTSFAWRANSTARLTSGMAWTDGELSDTIVLLTGDIYWVAGVIILAEASHMRGVTKGPSGSDLNS